MEANDQEVAGGILLISYAFGTTKDDTDKLRVSANLMNETTYLSSTITKDYSNPRFEIVNQFLETKSWISINLRISRLIIRHPSQTNEKKSNRTLATRLDERCVIIRLQPAIRATPKIIPNRIPEIKPIFLQPGHKSNPDKLRTPIRN